MSLLNITPTNDKKDEINLKQILQPIQSGANQKGTLQNLYGRIDKHVK
jgi:hypothetical protein